MAATLGYRICPLCEATCGLEMRVDDGRIQTIRGDKADVLSRGFLCPKGAALGELHNDPDRLRQPLVRRKDTLVPVAWDNAFDEVERRLMPIIAAHGANAVAVYLGNPTVHNLSLSIYGQALLRALRTTNLYSASTVDQM